MPSVMTFIATAFGILVSLLVPSQTLQPTITPTPIIVSPTPSPTPTKRMQFKDEVKKWPYSIKYAIWMPENGGTADGYIRGYGLGVSEDCTAHFEGNYEGGEGGKIEGDIEGKCETPLFGGKITGKLEGKVYPSKRYMQSWVKGKIGDMEFNEYLYTPRF